MLFIHVVILWYLHLQVLLLHVSHFLKTTYFAIYEYFQLRMLTSVTLNCHITIVMNQVLTFLKFQHVHESSKAAVITIIIYCQSCQTILKMSTLSYLSKLSKIVKISAELEDSKKITFWPFLNDINFWTTLTVFLTFQPVF